MQRAPVGLEPGTPATEVLPELGPEPEDLVLTRTHGLNPMAGTDLDPVLRNLGIRTIVATGVSVNIAITNLVMDAVNLGYDVVVPPGRRHGHSRGLRQCLDRQLARPARHHHHH